MLDYFINLAHVSVFIWFIKSVEDARGILIHRQLQALKLRT